MAQTLKRLPAMWETWLRPLGWEDPLEKEMATHSSILAWRIPWTEEQIDPLKPLPRINQYPISKESFHGIKPMIGHYKSQRPISCNSSCNTPILLMRKPEGWGWRFAGDLRTINNVIIPPHPVVFNPHTLLTSIPTGYKCSTVIQFM